MRSHHRRLSCSWPFWGAVFGLWLLVGHEGLREGGEMEDKWSDLRFAIALVVIVVGTALAIILPFVIGKALGMM